MHLLHHEMKVFQTWVQLKGNYYNHRMSHWSFSASVSNVHFKCFHLKRKQYVLWLKTSLLYRVREWGPIAVKSLWCSDFDVRLASSAMGQVTTLSLVWCLLFFPCRSNWSSLPLSQVSVKEVPPGSQTRGCPTCIEASTFKSSFSTCRERENYKMKPCPTGFTSNRILLKANVF